MNLPNLPNKQTALCEWPSEAPDHRERAGVWRARGCELLQGQCAESGTNHPQLAIRACSGTVEQQGPCALNVLNERDALGIPAMVRPTNLLRMSPTRIPLAPPSGFCRSCHPPHTDGLDHDLRN